MKKILIISYLFVIINISHSEDWKTYSSEYFSISYPGSYISDTLYVYKQLGEGKGIRGVSFTVPGSVKEATNLVEAYISVEWMPARRNCAARNFVFNSLLDSFAIENGVHYNTAYNSEGAAGSLYEEYVYSVLTETYCYGLRLFIHSSNIGNYDPGTVKEYDRAELENIFRNMRDSFKIVKQ
jgi:hypothetical protein